MQKSLLSKTLQSKNPIVKSTTEPYVAYGTTEQLLEACTTHCSYTIPAVLSQQPAPKNAAGEDIGLGQGFWLTPKEKGGLGLDVTFNSWAQVIMMYMYLLMVRFRMFPKEHVRTWQQQLLDHFFYAAEDRMAVWHGMASRSIRNKYLKDMYMQWRGVLLSYDEGLIFGDAALAAAVWRNLFKAADGVEIGDLAVVVAYMRRELKRLEALTDEEVTMGMVQFGKPEEARGLVKRESAWMRAKFSAENLGEAQAEKKSP
jgi:cytochrome b pre-mRNA-processing protein 3